MTLSSQSFPGRLGAFPIGDGRWRFLVWAPNAKQSVTLLVEGPGSESLSMDSVDRGYWSKEVETLDPTSTYRFRIDDGEPRPDPASHHQPNGVHGPSQLVDTSRFAWGDSAWQNHPLEQYITYELHVGTFTPEATFDAAIQHLDYLVDLGITAIELMPVSQFPGARNWGYDGVLAFAVQNTYGGPGGLQRLIDACHRKGVAVIVDVVYNHLGPEGNHLPEFGPYFTDRYKTPWGSALNFDGPQSDEVRRYFIENALYFVTDFHVDALRLDAVHAIADTTPVPFLTDLSTAVHERAASLGRPIYLIAESSDNDRRLITSSDHDGQGMDGQWNDDFHHALRVALTGQRDGYYVDYAGVADVCKALTQGYVYTGQYSPFRQRRHGSSAAGLAGSRFMIFSQNHDQIGNRAVGDRLSHGVSLAKVKVAAAATLLAPFLPLLFMGEEYGEAAPFPYFVSHTDPNLVEAVRSGRKEEFAAFGWQGEIPDPQDEATFQSAKLDHSLRQDGDHAALFAYYRELIRFRRDTACLGDLNLSKTTAAQLGDANALSLRRWNNASQVLVLLNLGDSRVPPFALPDGEWTLAIDSNDPRWSGSATESAPTSLGGGAKNEISLPPATVLVFTSRRGIRA